MYRSARKATELVWYMDTRLAAPVGVPLFIELPALSCMRIDASRLASSVTTLSSASQISDANARMNSEPSEPCGTQLDTMTGTPSLLPPTMVTSGHTRLPRASLVPRSLRAVLASVMYTADVAGMFCASAVAHKLSMSASGSLVAVRGVTPLVMDAGDAVAPVPAALSGSTKSVSIRSMTAAASSSRTNASAPGLLKRASSSVITAMPATLAQPRYASSYPADVTGLA